jgi:hypothetical protein
MPPFQENFPANQLRKVKSFINRFEGKEFEFPAKKKTTTL